MSGGALRTRSSRKSDPSGLTMGGKLGLLDGPDEPNGP
jgi:hypothetical protein